MKQFLLSLIFVIGSLMVNGQSNDFVVRACVDAAAQNATYLKDFQVNFKDPQEGDIKTFSLYLRKNTEYRFSICTAPDSEGQGFIELSDEKGIIGSSFIAESNTEYNGFNFVCNKTAVYNIQIKFRENKPGKAIGILSYVQSL